MARYPVRCCCTPLKVFGHLNARAGLGDGDRCPILTKAVTRLRVSSARDQGAISTRYETALFRNFRDPAGGIDEIAVFSEDRPIEFWRTVAGFQELLTSTYIEMRGPCAWPHVLPGYVIHREDLSDLDEPFLSAVRRARVIAAQTKTPPA